MWKWKIFMSFIEASLSSRRGNSRVRLFLSLNRFIRMTLRGSEKITSRI